MQLTDLNKDEKNLLLYLECQAVDYAGKLDARRMNALDAEILEKWKSSGFVPNGRIAFADIAHNFTNWCVLSEDAWRLAHEERRARCERLMAKLNVERLGLPEPEEP